MGRILLALALLTGCLACRKPEAVASPARLVVHFLDQDAVCGLQQPMPGTWTFMDAGVWRPLDTVWSDVQGRALIGRTAPCWVMLQDPEGGIHRIVLSDAPDTVRSQGTTDREDATDQAEGLFIVWLWLGHLFVDH
ncbi:MAG TPA: hypothetical protein VFF76_05530 [Holophagaceae bacterium]|jgi:hypothetical protein|nr:hypothetical protein [Holophagaceae bacterium]